MSARHFESAGRLKLAQFIEAAETILGRACMGIVDAIDARVDEIAAARRSFAEIAYR